MEVKTFFVNLALIFTLMSCANIPEEETGEIRTLKILKQAFDGKKYSKIFVDSRTLLTREQIDASNTPVLFVELESGQNGTLTPYPGQGIGQTWLGADGATVTIHRGILKATRGMGDDLMGSSNLVPQWSKINGSTEPYLRKFMYITGNNKIQQYTFKCNIKKVNSQQSIKVWGIKYFVKEFQERCSNNKFEIENKYPVDRRGVVRRSYQYHGETIGYIFTERIDR